MSDDPTVKKPHRSAVDELSPSGAFQRKDSVWRNWISREPGAKFPPAIGRYHLYVAYAW
jgi:glutathionyl-hydroquinone reductase